MITAFKDYVEDLYLGEGWLNTVTLKWHAPEGIFKNGSPEEIAKTLCDNADSYKQAMDRLVFYINRSGVKLPGYIRTKCEKAKEILRKICKEKSAKSQGKETKTA